jgi:hypothetical protein
MRPPPQKTAAFGRSIFGQPSSGGRRLRHAFRHSSVAPEFLTIAAQRSISVLT